MVKVFIPTPLRTYTGAKDAVLLDGATVGEVLRSLTSTYSSLEKHLFTEEGTLRGFVNIYVNDEDIRFLQKEKTKVAEDDTVSIIPSIAGG